MKQLLIVTSIAFGMLGCSCNDSQKKETAALDDVIAVHDKVMADDGALMDNKLQLDSLEKANLFTVSDTAAEKAKIKLLIKKLNDADLQMESWMQKFEPGQKGKSHEQVMAYLKSQREQITAIDLQLKAAVRESGNFLKNIKNK